MCINNEEYQYSNDKVLSECIKLIKNGCSEEEVQKKFNLSVNDMDLIDYVVNEL